MSKKKIVFMVSGLLITAAAVYAAQWRWHFWHKAVTLNTETAIAKPLDSLPENEVNNSGANNDFTVNNGIGIRDVLAAHLFGQQGVVKKTINSLEPIPKTQQPLELHGIVFIPQHPERAVALIAQAGGIAKDYKTGEELTSVLPGWKVFLILADAVQIEHQGTIESLALPYNGAQLNNPQAVVNLTNQPNNMLPQNNMSMQSSSPRPEEPELMPAPDNMPAQMEMPTQENVAQPPAAPAQNMQAAPES